MNNKAQTAIEMALGMTFMFGLAVIFLHLFMVAEANDMSLVEMMWGAIEHTVTAPYP